MSGKFKVSYTLFHSVKNCELNDLLNLKKYINSTVFKTNHCDYITLDIKVENPESRYLIRPELKLDNYEDIHRFVNTINTMSDMTKYKF
jgi:hypothetical protein